MRGLPGGSNGEGPATFGGIVLVVCVTLAVVAGLVWLLFQAVPV